MIINPIIPLWLMGIICIVLLCFKRKGVFNYIRQIIIIVLIFVINMRIMVSSGDMANMTNNIDVLFVVDNTISMLAEDYNGNERRLDAVKNDCNYIMEEFAGASFSLVVFDNMVERKMPYTIDTDVVANALEVLQGQSQYYAKGTSLNDVMGEMETLLKNTRDTYKIIFFVSDGEVINSEELKSYKGLSKYVDSGAVLGYGTDEGGIMRPKHFSLDDEVEEILYYYDEDDNWVQAISKIDENNLRQIAKDLDVGYVHAVNQKAIKKQLDDIKDKLGKNAEFKKGDSTEGYNETYFYFVFVLVVFLVVDFIYYKKKA